MNLSKQELLYRLAMLAHRKYDATAYTESIQLLVDYIDDTDVADAFARIPDPSTLDAEEEN